MYMVARCSHADRRPFARTPLRRGRRLSRRVNGRQTRVITSDTFRAAASRHNPPPCAHPTLA
eukprot:11184146-Lingulodinium_polyedra.AAC.1